MHFSVVKEDFLKPLQLVVGVIEKRPNLPNVLNHVLLELVNNTAIFTTSDSELEIITQTNKVNVVDEGKVVIPGKKLVEICRTTKDKEQINVVINNNKANIAFENSKFTLGVLPAADFPAMPAITTLEEFVLPAQIFKESLVAVGFAMAQQDVRSFLNGVLLEIKTNQLVTVATDGHRLASKMVVAPTQTEEPVKIILPRKAVLELIKLIGDSDQNLTLIIGESCFQVRCGNTLLNSRLIKGKFPSYERLLIKGKGEVAVVKKEPLKQAILRAIVLLAEKGRGAGLTFANNELTIEASNQERDEVQEVLSVNYIGPRIEVAFNLGYVIDFLLLVKGDEVKITLGRAQDGGVLFEDTHDPGISYVVMPMKL